MQLTESAQVFGIVAEILAEKYLVAEIEIAVLVVQKVVVFEQRTKRWDDEYYMRWLYTAVTRAKEKLFIISDYWG